MVDRFGAGLSDSGFLDFLVTAIKERSIPPTAIGFEITETVAVSNLALAR
jgi:EAL domain-containing protein (putative c-di-GMP-specific phosphodiesterase class I)